MDLEFSLAWGDKRSKLLDKYILFPLLKLSNCIQNELFKLDLQNEQEWFLQLFNKSSKVTHLDPSVTYLINLELDNAA